MSEEDNEAKNLYAIHGGKGTVGPIQHRNIKIKCQNCGNDEVFRGVARVEPAIEIRLQEDGSYDVTDIEYWQEDDVDEIPVSCMICDSKQLEITEQSGINEEDEDEDEDENVIVYQDDRITIRTKRSELDFPPF